MIRSAIRKMKSASLLQVTPLVILAVKLNWMKTVQARQVEISRSAASWPKTSQLAYAQYPETHARSTCLVCDSICNLYCMESYKIVRSSPPYPRFLKRSRNFRKASQGSALLQRNLPTVVPAMLCLSSPCSMLKDQSEAIDFITIFTSPVCWLIFAWRRGNTSISSENSLQSTFGKSDIITTSKYSRDKSFTYFTGTRRMNNWSSASQLSVAVAVYFCIIMQGRNTLGS